MVKHSDEYIKQEQLKMASNELTVGTCIVNDFFTEKVKTVLPDYQRPYVWDKDKVEQLFKDFEEHFFINNQFNKNAPLYYLGSILLYEKDIDTFEVIDGQQRITTLLITDYACNKNKSYLQNNNWNLEYSSLLSSAMIKKNYTYIKNLTTRNKQHIEEIFNKLVFTVIITNSKDEAFTFFDTQNARGVSLSAVDFLKSYHLRELKGKELLQEKFAKTWDRNNTGQFLNNLFNGILWRNREWKGENLYFEDKDAILNSFQKQTIKEADNEVIQLYPNVFNTLSKSLTFSSKEGVIIQPSPLSLQTRAEQYPFTIRQPIQKGIGFFLYTEKYFAIYQLLFEEKTIQELNKIYDELLKGMSHYFKSFFRLAIVSYYDKFKDFKLVEFALWLDYLLGSYRINQKSIVARTVVKILRDNKQNLLDVIEMAYRPEDVIDFLKSITNDDYYKKDLKDLGGKNGVRKNGVRKKYLKNNLVFFKDQIEKEDSLSNKKNWIDAYIINK